MPASIRRYDIDWLRVIAIGLLLIYHIGIGFQPWGVLIGFIQNDKSMHALLVPMSMLNIWRIPLLFFVSGMGVCFAMRKRSWKQLIVERTQRILVPFIFGIFFIVPVHIFIWQKYYNQDLTYSPHPYHLWFLGNIFVYVVLLAPVFYYLKKNENGKINKWIKQIFSNPLGLLLIVVSFILEVLIVRPEIYEMYALTIHGFFLGLLAFLFGFLIVHSGNIFWQKLSKWKWILLIFAVILFLVRSIVFELKAPDYLMSIESNAWIFAVFGFAYKNLYRPGKALSYLTQAAYPVYIIHMIFLYLGSYFIMPLAMPVILKFILVAIFTFAGCFASYELIIKRIRFLRPLFGLKIIPVRQHSEIKTNEKD